MKKWICEVCGYTHRGEEAPDRCPTCGASRSQFYQEEKVVSTWNTVSLLAIFVLLIAIVLTIFSCSSAAPVSPPKLPAVLAHI